MTDFCDFVPDSPECVAAADAAASTGDMDNNPPQGGDMMKGGKMDDDRDAQRDSDQMEANLTFLGTALGVTLSSALQLFRYRSDKDDESFYIGGDYLDYNGWKTANHLHDYSFLVLGGVAFITQLLSMFGIANEINLLVWMWGMGFVGMLVEAVAGFMLFYSYDEAYKLTLSDDAEDNSYGTGIMGALQMDALVWAVDSIMIELGIMMQMDSWYKYQMHAANGGEEWMEDGKMDGKMDGEKGGKQMELMSKIVSVIAF